MLVQAALDRWGEGAAVRFADFGTGTGALAVAFAVNRPRATGAVDLLGHGFSDDHPELSPEVVFGALGDTLERTVEEPFVLVGNSLGGALSLGFAQVRPERVRRLLLLSPGGGWLDPEELAGFLDQFRMVDLAAARSFIRRLYARTPWYGPFMPRIIRATFRRPTLQSFVGRIRSEVLQTPETLAQLQVPTAVLWGGRDGVLPRSTLDFFKRHLPQVRFDEPEDLGHCPQIEHPRYTLRWLAERVSD
jgi:pimeloyl-ACP methyl ester carboxylesterase